MSEQYKQVTEEAYREFLGSLRGQYYGDSVGITEPPRFIARDNETGEAIALMIDYEDDPESIMYLKDHPGPEYFINYIWLMRSLYESSGLTREQAEELISDHRENPVWAMLERMYKEMRGNA